MYQAKEEGKNTFQFYWLTQRNSFEKLALKLSLRRALERGEFQLHYQPKINLRSGRIAGMEALLRWMHPDLGMVAPTKFIPVAEETGLIVSIGKWVLNTACAQNVAWQKAGLRHLGMAVNLSPRQFLDENLLDDVTSILGETGMNPALLELEITEGMLMHNVDKAMAILQEFRRLGVRLAVDDFGTGYSSLSKLKRFPIDTIKVDRSFIGELPGDAENRGITDAIIAMGKALSLTVVAEGVETKEQAEYLREHACDEFQGFYFSKAVPATMFAELLKAERGMTDDCPLVQRNLRSLAPPERGRCCLCARRAHVLGGGSSLRQGDAKANPAVGQPVVRLLDAAVRRVVDQGGELVASVIAEESAPTAA